MLKNSLLRAPWRSLVGFAVLATASSAAVASYSQVVFFGDSLSDTGNLYASSGNTLPVSPPYDNGRFSNGPLWSEQFAAALGLSATPSSLGGTNYAWAGATVIDYGRPQPEIPQELGMYLAATGGVADSSALYVILGGANDINDAGLNPPTAASNVYLAALAVNGMVQALYDAGARNILVGNLPDIGLTPEAVAAGVSSGASALTNVFNSTLEAALAATGAANANLDLDLLDLYGLLNSAVADPSAFGFNDVADPCKTAAVGGPGDVCATPDTYLFWDAFHPSSAAHTLMANAALRAVPEPAALPLVVLALIAMWLATSFGNPRRASCAV